jgi:hypothetical protein
MTIISDIVSCAGFLKQRILMHNVQNNGHFYCN